MTLKQDVGPKKVISVLVVDDSLVFRRLLRDLIEDFPQIEIVAEAQNGIEALDQVLKTCPDVILMDLEMPIMDGMTALQHLMVHRPTPTIFFSSLTAEGTTRSFDALKNGAVDFICKDFVFEEDSYPIFKEHVLEKVIGAAGMIVRPVELFSPSSLEVVIPKSQEKVIFCEDCGTRQVVTENTIIEDDSIRCVSCGDVIYLHQDNKHHRNSFLTVVTGGYGSFSNLLDIIPRFEADMSGSLLCVIDAPPQYVDSFSEYLGSVSCLPVQRGQNDLTIEGGTCYILASSEMVCLKPYSASIKLQRLPQLVDGVGPMDIMIASAAKIFKSKSAVVILSGDGEDGVRGVSQVVKAGGTVCVLRATSCLYSKTISLVKEKLSLSEQGEEEIVSTVKALHRKSEY